MLRGSNHRFTPKDDREAKHIAASEEERGRSPQDAERIGYATVNERKTEKKDAP